MGYVARVLVQVNDAFTEAKDNVKFMRALDASWDPLYQADMGKAQAALRSILSNIYSVHAASRCSRPSLC